MLCLHSAFCILHFAVSLNAQQLIDRVLARVGSNAVTMSDVRAEVGLGLVQGTDERARLQGAIDRQLVLDEAARFPPPEASPEAVADEVAAMKSHAGADLPALMTAAGLDESRLQQIARETLRIRAYLSQRFGTTAQVTEDEVRRYYDEHPAEFTRDGVRLSFEDAETTARERASGERLRATIDSWIGGLRMRAEVVLVERK